MKIPWGWLAVLAICAGLAGLAYTQHGQAKVDRARGDSLGRVAETLKAGALRQGSVSDSLRNLLRAADDSLARLGDAALDSGRREAGRQDTLTGELREALPDTLKPKLDSLTASHGRERAAWETRGRAQEGRIRLLLTQVVQDSVTIDSLKLALNAMEGVARHWEESFDRQTRWDLPLGIVLPKWAKDVALVGGGLVTGIAIGRGFH